VTDGQADNTAEGQAATAAQSQARAVASELRVMLAEVTGRDDLLRIPPDAALFGGGVGLDSLAGTLLLRRVELRYGVDVAAEDLNLDALQTLGTLAGFIADRI
jgi:acyl carrier protein